jgi:citrate lyase beta subunit
VTAGAEKAVLDLEDVVSLAAKGTPRAALAFFAAPVSVPARFLRSLRLNHITTADGLHDLTSAMLSQCAT